ncbi:MAG TPA: peptidylprolyl isomerase [Verrucomicrobiae bacterium]|jgi:peptidyl-prolyl cis-trans isomerase A (cyclophilin A)|nr:peptidylprolyl isomerase [Verrucomicrobiae bacterium]
MHKLLITILCLGAFAAAQTTSTTQSSTTSQQHANSEKSTQSTTEPTADIETSLGTIHCVLFPDKAPASVANFIGLSTGTKSWKNPKTGQMEKGVPLYNGTVFHRVIPNFMIQGGDPAGTGAGDVGFTVKDETSPDLTFDQPGRLAYANAGPNTNGSQFFITEGPVDYLNGHYSIFGQCQDIDLVKKIARLARDPRNDRPYDPPKILKIKITDPRHPAAGKSSTGAAKKSTTPPPSH